MVESETINVKRIRFDNNHTCFDVKFNDMIGDSLSIYLFIFSLRDVDSLII